MISKKRLSRCAHGLSVKSVRRFVQSKLVASVVLAALLNWVPSWRPGHFCFVKSNQNHSR
ncbi:hypothetical protein AUC61_10985 [Pseudomonas sp. S25]|uniref:Uncharacterized protein n=1 Tax=Pseudomonas maioricensis TaxID=1766623 RepID=A0ABS9ZHH6_9PSED|nr:hypothetical protein [Pseudomonas sp. S25]